MKFTPAKPFLLGETLETLEEKMTAAGFPAFRAKQILEWIYKKFELNPENWTNVSKEIKTWIDNNFILQPLTRVLVKGDPDTTQKLLLKLGDGSLIETVLIKAPIYGEEFTGEKDLENKARKTVCISTQVGCAYGCKFCASGIAGWKRDLHAGEIVAQIFEIIKLAGAQVGDGGAKRLPFDNIVVMGMGEPLANFENLLRALGNLNAAWGFKFGARRITVSTSGVVPRIYELAQLPVQFRLAISLHGATNDVRSQIMPVNKKYPLEELIPAARAYNARHKRMITFEYILIDELNDTYEQADALVKLCRGDIFNDDNNEASSSLKVHINCIPYNKVEGLPWKRPSILRQQAFVKRLKDGGLSVTIRHEKGHKIEAACGQLRLQAEREAGTIEKVPAKK